MVADHSGPDAIIFDLGGVLLPIEYDATIRALSTLFHSDASAVFGTDHQDPLFDRYEKGEIPSSQFRRELCALFGNSPALPSAEEIDAAWNAMLGRLPESHAALLATLSQKTRLFLLSNTNEIHIRRFLADYAQEHEARYGPFSSLFEAAHYSHVLHLRKPQPSIFEYVLTAHDLDPSRTWYFDDSPQHVRSAQQLGIVATRHERNAPLSPHFQSL